MQWLSAAGDTTMRQIARKWGEPSDSVTSFLEDLFAFLVQQNLLRPVRLLGSKGKALPNLHDVYQVNGDALRLHPNTGVARCQEMPSHDHTRGPQRALSRLAMRWRTRMDP